MNIDHTLSIKASSIPTDGLFTVNMTTTDESTDTKSTVVQSPLSTTATITMPLIQEQQQQQRVYQHRSGTFDLARQLIAETSESEKSDESHRILRHSNNVYPSDESTRMHFTSTYNNNLPDCFK
jgi:hypothetical protein